MQPDGSSYAIPPAAQGSALAGLAASAIGRAALARHLPDNARVSLWRALGVLTFELGLRCAVEPGLKGLGSSLAPASAALESDVCAITDQPLRVDSASLEASLLAQRQLRGERGAAERLGQAHALLVALDALYAPGCAAPGGATPGMEPPALEALAAASAMPADTAALGVARVAAHELLTGVTRVVEAVGQLHDAAGGLLAALNIEAGNHGIPGDVRELLAALSASDTSFYSVRYYAARFGERGLRFSRSDSCWLATLARGTPAEAHRHVRWLGRVLSNRGMPELLLEQHLAVLHRALAQALPEHEGAYGVLLEVAAAQRAERELAMPPAEAEALCTAFAREVGSAGPLIDAAEGSALLCAAVADLRVGAPRAVASLASFLADPSRFGARWVAAVARLLRDAGVDDALAVRS